MKVSLTDHQLEPRVIQKEKRKSFPQRVCFNIRRMVKWTGTWGRGIDKRSMILIASLVCRIFAETSTCHAGCERGVHVATRYSPETSTRLWRRRLPHAHTRTFYRNVMHLRAQYVCKHLQVHKNMHANMLTGKMWQLLHASTSRWRAGCPQTDGRKIRK
jgi:hypothetical protein